MDIPWFYLPAAFTGNVVSLDDASAKHAVQVLRMREGDDLCITNGTGLVHRAVIKLADKKQCQVSIIESTATDRLLARKVAIGISPLKNSSRFEWFLEKSTELGVAAIYPLLCHRTVREHFRYERLQAICISAMLQSRQAWLPQLHMPLTMEQFLATQQADQPDRYHHKWIAHCAALEKHHLAHVLQPGMKDSLLLIGPEGDFTNEEIVAAENTGFVAVGLGETRLRTETAGVAAASLLCLL